VGHSHIPLAVTVDAGELSGGHAPAGTEIALGDSRWLLNPGSVGQPRDGDARAAWLLLDLDASTASFRRIDYAIAETNEEIREAGLPLLLGERLFSGA
jgi:diadenosine tetraphosphatase ApaH/serine/threonine PP2A family protein phosphatase